VNIEGTVVVVTGASSGFGELTALAFAREGAKTVLAARRMDRLEALAERIRALGGWALPVRCDVTELPDLEALRDAVLAEAKRCDVLVNNAGIPGGGAFVDLWPEQIERLIRVNVLGVMWGTKVFLPMMLEQGRGHVVNVASLAGRFVTPGASVYGASKHAVVGFSESLSYELAPLGILVTSVNPGFAATEGFPQRGKPSLITMRPERVAATIVDVVKRDRSPEVSVPRSIAALQAFRVITPPLYRWGVRRLARRLRPNPVR